MVFWLNCQWNQAKSWKIYRMPNTSGDRDTLLHVFVCVCTIGDTNMYGLVQIKKCFYLLFWSMVLFFIFSTPTAPIHTKPIFFTPSAWKSLVSWPLLQCRSWFQGCIKKVSSIVQSSINSKVLKQKLLCYQWMD